MTTVVQHKNVGLSDEELQLISSFAEAIPEIEKITLFGSRAKLTHKRASDVDMFISGKHITEITPIRFALLLEESILPYFCDVVRDTPQLDSLLKEHINRHGKVIYEKS